MQAVTAAVFSARRREDGPDMVCGDSTLLSVCTLCRRTISGDVHMALDASFCSNSCRTAFVLASISDEGELRQQAAPEQPVRTNSGHNW